MYFRAERGFPSRSSGLGSTSIRSVLEKIFTIQPSNHPKNPTRLPIRNRLNFSFSKFLNRCHFAFLLKFSFFLIFLKVFVPPLFVYSFFYPHFFCVRPFFLRRLFVPPAFVSHCHLAITPKFSYFFNPPPHPPIQRNI